VSTPPRVFLDTDVILDFVLKREGFFDRSARLFQAGMEGKLRLLASASSLKDVFYFARKPGAGEHQGSEKRGREVIRLLLRIVEVCPLDQSMWDETLSSPLKDTEDALQLACAGRNQAQFLVTRNSRDYLGALYPQVILPEQLLATLRAGAPEA